MYKTLVSIALLLMVTNNLSPAQVIVSGNPNSTTAGSSISMVITGSNTNFMAATGAYIYLPGTSNSEVIATNLSPSSNTNLTADFNIPPNAPLGNYTLGVYGPPELPGALSVAVGPGSNYGYISGKVNYDYNANCTIDPGEGGLPGRVVSIGSYNVSTSSSGFYSAWLPLGSYTVTTASPNFTTQPCPPPSTINMTVPLDSFNNVNLYLDTLFASDLAVVVTSGAVRPGFSFWAQVHVTNLGNDASSATTGHFTLPANLFSVINFNTATSTNGDTAFFNIPSLLPGTNHIFTASGTVSTSAPLNTLFYYRAHVDPAFAEANVNNNDIAMQRTVTGSYDPNDKQVWNLDGDIADGYIEPSDSVLRYLVRFQNTGTDTAFNIYVRDTLDPNLDVSTLDVESSSHPWTMNITGTGNVQWTFPNILLVDSFTNEPLSHGYISYTIKLKPGLPIGTQIDNTAFIYFDFNAPVVTNTVSSIICPEILPGFVSNSGGGNVINFTGSASSTVVAWYWDFGDSNSSTVQSPSHTYASSGLYNACLFTTNSCGRTDSVCQTLNVNCAAPASSFGSTVNGSMAVFSDQTSGNPSSWFWTFGDGGTSTQQNPSHTYAAAGTYTVCLVTTNNCDSDTSCQSLTVACAAPTAAYASSVTGATAIFNDQSTGSPTGWFWTFGDGGTSILQNPSHTYTAPGTYNVCLVATSVCGSDTSCSPVTTSCATPVVSFNASLVDPTVNLSDLSSNSPTSWLWTFGDGSSSTLQSPSHTYSSTGSYTICLVATNSCGSDTNCLTLSVVVGLEESLLNRFEIFPNPSQGQFAVEMDLRQESLVSFRMYNAVGSLLRSEPEALLSGEVHKSFDINDLPSGMYLLEMRVDGKSLTWKVMRE